MEASAAKRRLTGNSSAIVDDDDDVCDLSNALSGMSINRAGAGAGKGAGRGAEEEAEELAARRLGPNANVFDLADRQPDLRELLEVRVCVIHIHHTTAVTLHSTVVLLIYHITPHHTCCRPSH
jgi:hypothetical protein